jgi:hypothetical protein
MVEVEVEREAKVSSTGKVPKFKFGGACLIGWPGTIKSLPTIL